MEEVKMRKGYITFIWPDAVYYDGEPLLPNKSQALYNHSPSGFAWGYGGSGPAQLALAIMLHVTGDKHKARPLYQDFKWKFIATLPEKTCELEVAVVENWVAAKMEKGDFPPIASEA